MNLTEAHKLALNKDFIKMVNERKKVAAICRLVDGVKYETVRRARHIVINGFDPTYEKESANEAASSTRIRVEPREPSVLPEKHTYTSGGDVWDIDVVTTERSLEGIIKKFAIDTKVWHCDKFECGIWDGQAKIKDENEKEYVKVTPLYRSSARFILNKEAVKTKDIFEDLLEDVKNYAPKVPLKKYSFAVRESRKCLQEIAIFDLHLSKLAWAPETGDNYDSDIACMLFRAAMDDLVGKGLVYNPERFLLPVGNDFFNMDNGANTTTAGTAQDVDSRWKKVFKMGRELIVDAVEQLTEIAPVDVLIVPGNHDSETAWHLGESLDCWFHNNNNVTVDNSPKLRKHYIWGDCFIGFTHGNKEKTKDLPTVFQTSDPVKWGNARWRQIHYGHYHSEKELMTMPVEEHYGTILRQLPSLSGSDAYHYGHGYSGLRSAKSYIFHKDYGQIDSASYNVMPEDIFPKDK